MGSQVTLVAKNPLPMQETQEMWVQSLNQEDPLEEGICGSLWKRPHSWGEGRGRGDRRPQHRHLGQARQAFDMALPDRNLGGASQGRAVGRAAGLTHSDPEATPWEHLAPCR